MYLVHQKNEKSEQVTKLELVETGFSDEKISILLQALNEQGHLKILKLRGEKIGPKTLQCILNLVKKQLSECLLELHIVDCR